MPIFDIALEKRFDDSTEIALVDLSDDDTFLIKDLPSGLIVKLSVSVLKQAIIAALAGQFATLVGGKVPAAQLPNSDSITEGSTNKYYTDARARAAVSAGSNISYSSATGVIAVATNPSFTAVTASGNMKCATLWVGAAVTYYDEQLTVLAADAKIMLRSTLGYGWGISNEGSSDNGKLVFRYEEGAIDVLKLDRLGNGVLLGNLTVKGGTVLTTSTALTSNAGALGGTLTNSPVAGNPTKWIPINDNGTTRYIPVW